jgi:hydroxyacylglutathione hydrolase
MIKLHDNLYAFIWESMTVNNCNTYLINGPTRILIDPGHANLFEHVKKGLDDLELNIDDIGLIICTHAHPDHMEAVKLFKNTPSLFAIHKEEWKLVKSMEDYINSSLGVDVGSFLPDIFLKEGDLSVHDLDFKIFHTPGHSPGSISLYWPEQKALFTGDVIFKEALGRTDLPGGNGAKLKESIEQLSELEAEHLLSGHGEIVSGFDKVKENFDHVMQAWFNYI